MNRRTKRAVVTASMLVAGAITSRAAQAQISLTTSGTGTYLQNFDGLSNSATNAPFNANGTFAGAIAGWSSVHSGPQSGNYSSGTGSSNGGALYSFGGSGSTDRALGSVASGTTATVYFGAQFQNNVGAGVAIDAFSVAYTGEQWRDGGNASGAIQTNFFEWSTDATSITGGTWNSFSSLDFASPTHAGSTSGVALDGNQAANQTVFGPTQVASALNLAPGDSVWIRWRDPNDTGNDHGLAVDDFTFSYTTGTYVETSRNLTWDFNTGTAGAQNGAGTWQDTGTNWLTSGNAQTAWTSVATNHDNALFGTGSGTGNFTITVGGAVTANKITFVGTSPTYTIGTPGSTNVVTIDNGVVANQNGVFNAPLSLTNNQSWNVSSGSTVTANGTVTGNKIIKTGAGTLRLSNSGNSHNGVQLDAGSLEVGADGELGTSSAALVSNGGTIKLVAPNLLFPGPGGGLGGRTFTLSSGTTTIDTNGNNAEIAGDLTGGGAMNKNGLGTLTLSSPSESDPNLRYTGITNINAGTLRVNSQLNNFTAIGQGNTNINTGGTFHIDNVKMGITTGSVSSRVFINNGGTLLGTGTAAEYNRASDALTVQNGTNVSQVHVTLATSGATDLFQLGNSIRINSVGTPADNTFDSSFATIHVAGPGRILLRSGRDNTSTVAFRGDWSVDNGTLQVGPITASAGNTSQVLNALGFRYNGSASAAEYVPVTVNALGMLALGVDKTNPLNTNVPDQVPDYLRNPVILNGGKLASTAYEIDVNAEQDPTQPVNGKLGGGFTTTAAGGTVLLYNPIADPLVSPDDFQGPRNVHLVASGNTTWGAGQLVLQPFSSSVGGKFVIERTGGTVTVTPGASILVNQGATLELGGTAGALSDGTNHVNIVNNSTTSVNVVAGTHNVGNVSGSGNTNVSGGATLVANHIRQAALNIANNSQASIRLNGGNSGTSQVGTLNLNTTGVLNVGDNDLIVNTGSYTTIRAAVVAGLANNNSAARIISSNAIANTRLALFDNAARPQPVTSWNGLTVPSTAIIAKYTYFGDVNIDGQVTGDDYTVIDANLGTTPTTGLEWISGDANADFSVTGDDYTVVDSNLGLGVGNPLSPSAIGGGLTPSSLSAVPEPGSLAAVAAASAGLLLRRRRTR